MPVQATAFRSVHLSPHLYQGTASVIVHLRTLGMQVYLYLEDILLVAWSRHFLRRHFQIAVSTLQGAGFVIFF